MDTLFADYENFLIGRKNGIGSYNFYGKDPGGSNQQRAIACIRYCLEQVLEWDADEAIKKFDEYIIKVMKLEKLLSYIKWPIEVREGDPKYVLSLLYPDKIRMNPTQLVEEIYKSVLDGKGQFPREYFTGADGFFRFSICLRYLIENYKPFGSIEEMYQFFGSSEGKRFLFDYRLKVPAEQFDINIYDCIYRITEHLKDSQLYHSYFIFLDEMKRLEK